jgi:L-seryl-tRNA(Ser) seleniumtransferase
MPEKQAEYPGLLPAGCADKIPPGNDLRLQDGLMRELLKKIPAVGDAVNWPELAELLSENPRSIVVEAISSSTSRLREAILAGDEPSLSRDSFVAEVTSICLARVQPKLRRVVNGTGIIVHTNLGRSVLAPEAIAAVVAAAGGFTNLEYDISGKGRGNRRSLTEELLCEITGAEAALAVNNNAAAVLLALNTLAERREVIVSRGELVEIGGSFRIPDVMRKSGGIMVEVGTTNKTHPKDYRAAVTDATGLLLKVHASNYRIMGFTSAVPASELKNIGLEFGIPVMEDLGSGYLYGPSLTAMREEPPVSEPVKAGIDVVTFSGDKLLGGPQAGILVGKKSVIDAIAKNPIARAVRCDKMTLAALEATLRLYRDPKAALDRIPTLRMADASLKTLREKARRLAGAIRDRVGNRAELSVKSTTARIGGGALPLYDLPSAAVAVSPKTISAAELDRRLHRFDPPVIGRVESDQLLIDVRTLLDGEPKIVENAAADAIIRGES